MFLFTSPFWLKLFFVMKKLYPYLLHLGEKNKVNKAMSITEPCRDSRLRREGQELSRKENYIFYPDFIKKWLIKPYMIRLYFVHCNLDLRFRDMETKNRWHVFSSMDWSKFDVKYLTPKARCEILNIFLDSKRIFTINIMSVW